MNRLRRRTSPRSPSAAPVLARRAARNVIRGPADFPADPWQWLAEVARRRSEDGLIPVLGTGFNAQAGRSISWLALLEKIQAEAGVSLKLPGDDAIAGNTTLVWEAMLLELAHSTQRRPSEVEADLQRTVAKVLRATYQVGGVTAAFAREFLQLGFEDVISFNFDEGLHTAPGRWSHKPAALDPLISHCVLQEGARVWYPHGSVVAPDSIQLGLRKYGVLIRALERARGAYKSREDFLMGKIFGRPERDAEPSTMAQRRKLWSAHRQSAQSWLSTAMNAPLLFIGLGMGREEWPLWWFLNQRARNLARRRLYWELPTFVFIPKKEAAALREPARLTHLTLLEFDDYDRGWDKLLRALRG